MLVLTYMSCIWYRVRILHTFLGMVELCFIFVWISPQQQSEQLSFLWCIQRWIIYRGIKAFVLESETDSRRRLAGTPTTPPSFQPSSTPRLIPRCVVALHNTSLDGCLKCKSVFQLVPGACQHVFLLSAAIECRPMSPLYHHCNRIVDRPVTLPNRIMETYWFFFLFSYIFFPLQVVSGT